MYGWMRLWSVMSVIWVIAIGIATLDKLDRLSSEPSNLSIYYALDDETKPFFERLREDPPQTTPTYITEVQFDDGTTRGVRFALMDETQLAEFSERGYAKIKRIAEIHNKTLSKALIDAFIVSTISNNLQASAYSDTYKDEVERQTKISETKSSRHLEDSFLLIFCVPLFALLLGYSVAWVRRGFSSN